MTPDNKEQLRRDIYIRLIGNAVFLPDWDAEKISETCDLASRVASIAVTSYEEEQDEINYFEHEEETKGFKELIDEHIPREINEALMHYAVGHSSSDYLFGPCTLAQALNFRNDTTRPLYIFNLKTEKAEYYFSQLAYKFVENLTA